MPTKPILAIGSRVLYDGESWIVDSFVGAELRLRSSYGKTALVAISSLANAPDFKLLDITLPSPEDSAVVTFPDSVPADAMKAAKKLLEHLNEVETGYRSGNLTTALNNEPRPQYDPEETTLRQRIEAKSKETLIAVRTLWSLKAAYKTSGIYGLVDQRQVKARKSKVDPKVISSLHHIVSTLEDASNVTHQSIIRRVKKHIAKNFPDEDVPIPPDASFNRLIHRETKNRALFSSAKGRRSINNRPATTYRRFYASRPGEMVLIDTTPLDAFAVDPVSFEWMQVQLTIALDLNTRSIVAWRFTPRSTKGVDAALLLYDIIRPKLMQRGWPDSARWAYVGVPEYIVIELAPAGEELGIAGIPVLLPDTIVVDHGKVFISQAFRDGCVRLGINLQLARPYTPTDKAHVERVFRTIRENFVMELPGYKGPDIFSRGLDPEGEAFYFLDEIETLFATWVATWWQRREHEGLDLPYLPYMKMCPNDMYNEGIARAGFVHIIADKNMYYELLPTEWRTVQHYGVEFRGLRYDGDILNDFRNKLSPYSGLYANKWPVRYDPRDLSRAFFFDYETNIWHTLHWIHSEGDHRPFNEATLSFAKALVISRSGNPGNQDELAEALNALIDRMGVTPDNRKERRLAAVNAMHAQLAKGDRPKAENPYSEPDAEVQLTDGGPITGARTSVADDKQDEGFNRAPLRSIDEAMEDDDDDLDF